MNSSVAEALSEEVLDEIWRMLSVEDPWALRSPGSIIWWPHKVAQRITVSPSSPSAEQLVLRASIETDCLVAVPLNEKDLFILDFLNRATTLAGLSADPKTGRVFTSSVAYVEKGNISWQKTVLALAAGLSAVRGVVTAKSTDLWAEGVRADESAHPTSGRREAEDDILYVPEKVFVPTGAGESRFVGDPVEELQSMSPEPWVLASGSGEGFTAEFPFWGSMPATMSGGGRGPETALLQVTTQERNPAFGSGALLRLTLPLGLDKEAALRTVVELNLRESNEWTGFDHFGAWCADPDHHSVTYVTFLPSRMRDQVPVCLRVAVWNMAARARWTANLWAAGLEERSQTHAFRNGDLVCFAGTDLALVTRTVPDLIELFKGVAMNAEGNSTGGSKQLELLLDQDRVKAIREDTLAIVVGYSQPSEEVLRASAFVPWERAIQVRLLDGEARNLVVWTDDSFLKRKGLTAG